MNLDVAGGTVVTINGTGYKTNGNLTVTIGNKYCDITSTTATSIICTAPDQDPGMYMLKVFLADVGAAREKINVTYNLVVTDFQPRFGSMVGGTEVIITGHGFGNNASCIDVVIGTSRCETKDVSDTHIKCMTPSSAKVVAVSNNGISPGECDHLYEFQ